MALIGSVEDIEDNGVDSNTPDVSDDSGASGQTSEQYTPPSQPPTTEERDSPELGLKYWNTYSPIISPATPQQQPSSPAPPRVTWNQISNSSDYKSLSPSQQMTVLHNYAEETRNYLKTIPGADPDLIDRQVDLFSKRAIQQDVSPEDTSLSHQFLNAIRVAGSDVGAGIMNALSGLARLAAQDATGKNRMPGITEGITGGYSTWIEKGVGNLLAGLPFSGVETEAGKSASDALNSLADFFAKKAENIPQESNVDLTLEKTAPAKIAHFGAGLGTTLAEGAIPEVGLPLLLAHNAMQRYGEIYNETGDADKAANARDISLLGNALFLGVGHGITEGLGKVLERNPSPNAIMDWAVKASAATAGNIGVNQLIKAADAAAQAEPGKRMTTFTDALGDVSIEDAALATAFGVHSALVERKIAAARKFSEELSRAQEYLKNNLPLSAQAQKEAAQSEFEQAMKELQQAAAPETITPAPEIQKRKPGSRTTRKRIAPETAAETATETATETAPETETTPETEGAPEAAKSASETGAAPPETTPETAPETAPETTTPETEVAPETEAVPETEAAPAESEAVRGTEAAPETETTGAAPETETTEVSPETETTEAAPETETTGAAPETETSPKTKKRNLTRLQMENATLGETAPAGATVSLEPTDIAHQVKTDLGKYINVPKGTTVIRVIDSDGRKAIIPIRDLKGANVLEGAGPFKSIEAGTIGKNGKFNLIEEKITAKEQKPAVPQEPALSVNKQESTPKTSARQSRPTGKPTEPIIKEPEEQTIKRPAKQTVKRPVPSAEAEKPAEQATEGPPAKQATGTPPAEQTVEQAVEQAVEKPGAKIPKASKIPPVTQQVKVTSLTPDRIAQSQMRAWIDATYRGVAEELIKKGVNPESVKWTPERVSKIASTILQNHIAHNQGHSELLRLSQDRVQDDLIKNARERGNPFKTKPSQKTGKDTYSIHAALQNEIGNYKKTVLSKEVSGEAPVNEEQTVFDRLEGAQQEKLGEQILGKKATPIGEESSVAPVVRQIVTKYFSKFVKAKDLPLGRAENATPEDILKAAHAVYRGVTGADFGEAKGLSENAEKLRVNPEFQEAVKKRIIEPVANDIRAAIPRDREPALSGVERIRKNLISKLNEGLGVNTNPFDTVYKKAGEMVENGVPVKSEVIKKSIPKEAIDRAQEFEKLYETNKGARRVLERIAETSNSKTPDDKLKRALAVAISHKIPENMSVIVDPTLMARRGAYGLASLDGKIYVSPFMLKNNFDWIVLHESIHQIIDQKVVAYEKGEHTYLQPYDIKILDDLKKLHSIALDDERVPVLIRMAAEQEHLYDRYRIFTDSRAPRIFYGLAGGLREFVTEALTYRPFQEFLNTIDASRSGVEIRLAPKGKTIWDKVKQLLRKLVFGIIDPETTKNSSVLAQAFDRVVDLIHSGSIEEQLTKAYLEPVSQIEGPPKERMPNRINEARDKIEFLNEFARQHGSGDLNELAIDHPGLLSAAADTFGEPANESPKETFKEKSLVSTDADVQKKISDRSKTLFDAIKKIAPDIDGEKILREAMENGATTVKEFAQVFRDAGLEPKVANAVAKAVESHFKLAAAEKADEIARESIQASLDRLKLITSPINNLAERLGIIKEPGKFGKIREDIQKQLREFDQSKLLKNATSPFDAIPKITDALSETAKQLRSAKYSGFQKVVRKFTGDLQLGNYLVRKIGQELNQRIPDKITQEGITNWIQANGDQKLLAKWAEKTEDEDLKKGYEAALHLTAEQIKIAQHIKKFYDDFLQAAQQAGLLEEGRVNYATQIWKDPHGFSERLFGRSGKLRTVFEFAKKAKYANFFEGEQAGLKPVTKQIVPLMQVYASEFQKVLATRDFIKNLTETPASDGRNIVTVAGSARKILGKDKETKSFLIRPLTRPSDATDYKAISNPAFSKWKWVAAEDGKPIFLRGQLVVHPEYADHIKSIFGQSAIRQWYNSKGTPLAQIPKTLVRFIDKASSETKNLMLSVLSPFHYVQEGTHAIGHRINPFWGLKELDLTAPEVYDSVIHGLVLAHDDQLAQFAEGLGAAIGTPISKPLSQRIPILGKYIVKPMSEHLFMDYIPRLKLTTYAHALNRNMKLFEKELASGELTASDVKALTADQMNAAYGMLNYEALGRDPTIRHIAQLLLLAPDFLESRARFTGQAIKGLASKSGTEQLVALAFLAATQWIASRIFNKILDGDYHFDHPFSVIRGGREYTMRSVPEDIYRAFKDSRAFIYGRLNPIIGRGAVQYASGTNYRGEKVTWADTTRELATQWIPIWLRSMPGIRNLSATEKHKTIDAWESFMSAWGLQTARYSPINAVYALAQKYKKSIGIKEDTGVYPVSKYQRLRYALEDGRINQAQKEYDALRQANPKIPPEKLSKEFHESVFKPFTTSKQMDQAFSKSLKNEYQRNLYEEALRKRREIWNAFMKLRRYRPIEASQSAAVNLR